MNPDDQPIQPTADVPSEPTPPTQPLPIQSMEFVPPPPDSPVPIEQPIQMPPYAPAQPPVDASNPLPDIPNPVAPNPMQPTSAKHKKDILGIFSIIFCFSFPLGLTLGLLGASKAKKAHRSPVLSRVGWILSLVIMLVAVPLVVLQIMSNMDAAKIKERDTERAKDLSAIEAKLEEYFSDNFGYPNNLDDLVFGDEQVLIGPNGSTIKVNDVASDEDEAKATTDPNSKVEYTYTPYGKPTCLSTCDGYVLKSLVEAPTNGVANPLVKLGLENL